MANVTVTDSTPTSSFSSSSTFVAVGDTTTSIYTAPTSTFTPPPSTAVSTSVELFTSVVTENPATTGGTAQPTIVYVTSTETPTGASTQPTSTTSTSKATTSSSSSAISASSASASATAAASSSPGGISSSGKIAVAVVVPIAAIAALVLAALFFWRKRKAKKSAEEQRRKEIEEYGFNPNNDPTIPPVGTAANYGSEMTEDGNGYRGWGATAVASTTRKSSTNQGSGRGGPAGAAVSDSGSNPGGHGYQSSPSNGTGQPSGFSEDPLVASSRPMTGDSETIGALGGAMTGAAASGRYSDKMVHRGPSNASSGYSNGHARSEASDNEPMPGTAVPYYHQEAPYYNEAQPQHGPYGDGTYGGGQPVLRDVQARRDTRIERPLGVQQPSSSGIAQNF